MNLSDEYDDYLEKMLLSQFKASELFTNKLTKGESREDFLIDKILDQFSNYHIKKGHIFDNNNCQSDQCDIIIYDKSNRSRKLGFQSLVDIEHAYMTIEVKSNATLNDFRKANLAAAKIKNLNSINNPICGLFCYQLVPNLKNLLRKFNYSYREEIAGFLPNYFLPHEFPNLDFILSLHITENDGIIDDKQFFIVKDRSNNGQYELILDKPVCKYLFKLL